MMNAVTRTLSSNADRIEHAVQRSAAIAREVLLKRLAAAGALGVLVLILVLFLFIVHA